MSVVHMYGWWACFAVGAWVPVSQLAEHEVAAYSKLEEDRASRALDDLLHICTSQRVRPFLRSDQSQLPFFFFFFFFSASFVHHP